MYGKEKFNLIDGWFHRRSPNIISHSTTVYTGKSVAQEESQDAKPQNNEVNHVKETLSVETETTEQMKSRLEAKRKENVGRPKKGEAAKIAKKSQEVRATFIVDADLLRKVKYISLVEGLLLKDVIAEALNAYVNKWEEVNRKIRLPKVK